MRCLVCGPAIGWLLCWLRWLESRAPAPQADIPGALPFGPLLIRLDPLGAFFLLVIGLVSTPVALYSIGYFSGRSHGASEEDEITPAAHARPTRRDLRPYAALLNLLLLSFGVDRQRW
jgi:formate hydrogenlyase subunit 3/multisubunit Na+/H+ antiporter MnhD subunit